MSSLLTNASAMTALQTLTNINKNLATTQERISTGMRVNKASDNAAYWSIATTMRSDNKANSVVLDALALGAGKVDTAYTAMTKAMDVVDQIKEKVLLAKNSSKADREKIQSEIKQLQAQLEDSVKNATYAGANLLATDASEGGDFSVISSYNRDSDGGVSTGAIKFGLAATRLIDTDEDADTDAKQGILDKVYTVVEGEDPADNVYAPASVLELDVYVLGEDEFDFALAGLEMALKDMTSAASTLGAAKTRIDLQIDFVKSLSDAIDRGVGALVDADMNEESARLSALQVQQQLGIQALSIANANAQNILALFR